MEVEMNSEKLVSLIQKEAREFPLGEVRKAAELILQLESLPSNSSERSLVTRAVWLLTHQSIGQRKPIGRTVERRSPRTPTHLLPDQQVAEGAMLRSLKSEVTNFRRFWFGSAEPPFRDRREAAAWIEGQQSAGLPSDAQVILGEAYSANTRKLFDLHDQLYRAVEELESFMGAPVRIRFGDTELRYYKPRHRKPSSVVPMKDSPLEDLADCVAEMEERTGFRRPDLVSLILNGTRPKLERIIVRQEAKGPLSEVIVTIRAQSPCQDDLLTAYQEICRVRGKGKASLFDEKDWEIWQVVESLGGPPDPICKKSFWESVLGRVARPDGRPYKDWRAVYQRWNRLSKKNPRLNELERSSRDYSGLRVVDDARGARR